MKTKHIVITAIVILLLLFGWYYYNNNKYQQLKGQYEILEEQYNSQKMVIENSEKERQKEKDSLLKENKQLKQENKKADQKIAVAESRIKQRTQQAKKDEERIKNMDLVQVAQEINEIYQTNEATATDTSVDLKGDLSSRVLQTVYDADECQDIMADKDAIIAQSQVKIGVAEKENKNLSIMLTSAEEQIGKEKGLRELGEENTKNLEKQLRKVKTNSTLKTVFIVVSAGAGFYLGTQIK